jgi:cell pole-organizing protein PopZ
MTQAAKSQEPSMEEILASIRRIIADDDGKETAVAKQPAPQAAPQPAPMQIPTPVPSLETQIGSGDDAILDLTEPADADEGPAFRTIEPGQDLVFDEPEAAEQENLDSIAAASSADAAGGDMASMMNMARKQFDHGTGEADSLLSSSTTAAVDSAFNTLAQTVLVQNSRTLDDLVREMLRPMLKAWLDDNLPNMVERMIRAEIDRVSRGRG